MTIEAVNEEDDIDLMNKNVCGMILKRGRNNKDILAQVCNLLNINTNVLDMPNDGFTQESMGNACAIS